MSNFSWLVNLIAMFNINAVTETKPKSNIKNNKNNQNNTIPINENTRMRDLKT